MKIYALYYKDEFVVAFPNREDCVEYGKKYYTGLEWDCSITLKSLCDEQDHPFVPTYPQTTTAPYIFPNPQKHIWTCKDGPTATFNNNQT